MLTRFARWWLRRQDTPGAADWLASYDRPIGRGPSYHPDSGTLYHQQHMLDAFRAGVLFAPKRSDRDVAAILLHGFRTFVDGAGNMPYVDDGGPDSVIIDGFVDLVQIAALMRAYGVIR